MTQYVNRCSIGRALAERARNVKVIGHGPLEEYNAEVEVISGADGTIELHVRRSHLKKIGGGKKWHTQSVYVTLTAEAWQHLVSAR